MPVTFVSEPITPLEGSFDPAGMARGEPGLPHQFRWRKKDYAVAEILGQGKAYGDCKHGSGERYVRRHSYRVRTTDGTVFQLYFQRSFGRVKTRPLNRWWVQSCEVVTTSSSAPPRAAATTSC
jgi:phosphoribosylglycinamide formyltransferase-1